MEDTRSFFKNLTKDDVLINLNGYDYSPDSLPKEIYLQFKDSITDYNRTRRFKNFTAFISNSNVLHVYNSQNQKHLTLMQEYISIPLIQELFFYDFDKDSIPELFIFFHFFAFINTVGSCVLLFIVAFIRIQHKQQGVCSYQSFLWLLFHFKLFYFCGS